MFSEEELKNLRDLLSVNARKFFPKDLQSAEDLVGDTLLKILVSEGKFEMGTNLKGWAIVIQRNLFINNYRSRIKKEEVPEIDGEFAPQLAEEADQRIRMEDIFKEIDNLPDTQRECFNMYLDSLQYDEISKKLNVPIGTVKSRIFMARKRLQQVINIEADKASKIIEYKQTKNLEIMAQKSVDKKENLTSFFSEVFSLSNNRWLSVKEYPLTPIQRKHSLDFTWGKAINHVLKQSKVFSMEGERSGIRYRSFNATIPDFSTLADMAIEYRNSEEKTPKSDLTPKRPYKRKEVTEAPSTPKVIKKRTHFNVDEKAVILWNRSIIEVEVVGVDKNEDSTYIHKIRNPKEDFSLSGVLNIELYESPEQLLNVLRKRILTLK